MNGESNRDPEVKDADSLRFVLHEHHAKKHHFDFRLEKEGVLKSWAIPKGLPGRSGEKRLAIETEDHPMDYIEFEGTIPEGEYGAGDVKIADQGWYEPLVWSSGKIEFVLHGRNLKGKYVFLKFKKAGEKEWIVLKGND